MSFTLYSQDKTLDITLKIATKEDQKDLSAKTIIATVIYDAQVIIPENYLEKGITIADFNIHCY